LANYNPKDYEYMFTAGYPKLRDKSPWRFTLGQIYSKERGLLVTTQSDFKNNSSSTSQSAVSLTGGYELVYSSITFGGMSGGPVLDSQGRVIGIHGRTEGEAVIDNNSSSGGTIQLGNSLGIPVSTFLAIATRLNTQAQRIETTPPPELNQQKADSIKTARLSIDVDKGNTTASQWLERGNQLWRLRRHSEAIQAFDEAIKQQPKFIHLAYYGKGLALGWSKKYPEAIAAFEQAVKYKPDFVPAWYYLGGVYQESKQLDKALVAINKAIQLQPNNPNLYNQKFFVLNSLKRYEEAELVITEAIELSHRAAFYLNRGFVYYNQKKWELALANYNTAIAINPDLAQAYNNRGIIYYSQQKWELALVNFDAAIAINPDLAQAYPLRGVIYHQKGNYTAAMSDYNQAIAKDTNKFEVIANIGLIKYEQGDINTAIKQWQQRGR
jgi:tetratricopeptide (TPR) repeat protein